MAKKAIIIGGGLFGSMAAWVLSLAGYTVRVIDAQEPMSASKAAGGLMKPSWMPSGLPKEEIQAGLKLLDAHFGLRDVVAKLPLGVETKLQCVSPTQILWKNVEQGRVTKVSHEGGWVMTERGETLVADVIVIAAGAWCTKLLANMYPKQELVITPQEGWSFLFKGKMDGYAHIRPWAPYKQIIAVERDPGVIWVGDGSALIPPTTEARYTQSLMRCEHFLANEAGKVAFSGGAEVLTGWRPYVKGHKSGYFRRLGKHSFITTGGAKNGTILAAIQALKLLDELGINREAGHP